MKLVKIVGLFAWQPRLVGGLLGLLLLVAVGMQCRAEGGADFDMLTRDGKAYSLDSIRTPLTLLFLNNPDCDMCHSVSDSICGSEAIAGAVDAGRVTVLAVYPGTDWDLWQSQPAKPYAVDCINPSMSLMVSDYYDFSSLPALFLIDRKRNILLVNTTIKDVEKYLSLK